MSSTWKLMKSRWPEHILALSKPLTSRRIVGYLSGIAAYWGLYALYAWTIFRFGGSLSSTDSAQSCLDRRLDKGFVGNSDFYGLGIRLGLYLQWAAILFMNVQRPDAGRDLARGYAAFSVALVIALLLLVFGHACAFTAEIIVLLAILFGGGFIVLLPLCGMPRSENPRKGFYRDDFWRDVHGFQYVFHWFYAPLSPVAAWFWLRQISHPDVDFERTPGGTDLCLFGRLSLGNTDAVRFMAVICVWFMLEPAFMGLIYVMGLLRNERAAWICVLASGYSIELLLYYCLAFLFFILAMIVEVFMWAFVQIIFFKQTRRELATRWSLKCRRRFADKDFSKNLIFTIGGTLVFIYAVLAVELTLHWNHITGVYVVDSTGQIIPLIAGILVLIWAAWRLLRKERRILLPVTGTCLQNLDGSWQCQYQE